MGLESEACDKHQERIIALGALVDELALQLEFWAEDNDEMHEDPGVVHALARWRELR